MDNKNFEDYQLNGYMPSPKDDRDYTIDTVCAVDTSEIPEEYKTPGYVPVLNQGRNSDCVAHAIAVATAYGQYKAEGKFNDISRGYIYGNRRPTDYQGEGMYVRQALKNFNHDGDCLNTTFPYRGTYPEMKSKIEEDKTRYSKCASNLKLINYFRLYNEREIKKAIMLQGSVVVGITTYDTFGTYIGLPTKNSKKTGGHAMCCIGWNKDGWILQNSWSVLWGDRGFCYLPYDYPVDEWWGLTASHTTADKEKDGFFKRLSGFFKNIIAVIKNFFHK